MGRRTGLILLAVATLAPACAGSKAPPSSHAGSKVLTAVVTERQYDAPTSGGGSYAGSGTFYLSFEAEEGERTVHYRFTVTRTQYFRYPEGTRVQLVLLDDQLREIRPKTD